VGHSLGKNRQWQPVRSTFTTAQNTSYWSTVVGLARRRTLLSSGSICANFSQVVLLAWFFLFIYASSRSTKFINTF
jgi:hypothetical protein